MNAIQFETVVSNNVIPIPVRFRNKIRSGSKVKVITTVSADDDTNAKQKKGLLTVNDFTELKIDTQGFKFNREDANERN